jgi:cytochrome c biogenesis protein CcdA/thiol-disulfide isomerase/thioredoxin
MFTEFQWINFFLAFLEGLALIVSPCILPILPILLSSTITGGKRRPLGIIIGFSLTFAVFTLLSHFLVAHLKINLDVIRDAAFILIILFGIVMISDYLTEKFSLFTQKLANLGNPQTLPGQKSAGFFSGLLMGSLVSLIWTPCAGPILAAALIQIAVQKTTTSAFLALLAFALGSAVPMLIIALLGKTLIHRINFIKKRTGLLRKIFGVIIIVTTVILAYISHFRPQIFASLTQSNPSAPVKTIPDESLAPYPAPPLAGLGPWINSAPLTLSQLRGKVVLIDFWTYSCINCIRTLPYLLMWDKKYRDQGLVIIGVHTPEFEFEKNPENVRQAVIRFNIHYAVALDNQYMTWNNYNNHYWPAHYLIDQNGRVVSQQFGEGHYAETERHIRLLLGLPSEKTAASSPAELANYTQTPETYLGSARAENFASPEPLISGQIRHYTFPSQLPIGHWALEGDWKISAESILSSAPATAIKIHFHAEQIYVVIGNTTGNPIKIRVLLNNKPMTQQDSGADVQNGVLTVTTHRLYALAHLPQQMNGEITLIIDSPGIEFYTFTFG